MEPAKVSIDSLVEVFPLLWQSGVVKEQFNPASRPPLHGPRYFAMLSTRHELNPAAPPRWNPANLAFIGGALGTAAGLGGVPGVSLPGSAIGGLLPRGRKLQRDGRYPVSHGVP